MNRVRIVTASEFEIACSDLLAQIGDGEIQQVTVTKNGKPFAVLAAPKPTRAEVETLFGMMEGSVIAPPGFDFTAPVFRAMPLTVGHRHDEDAA